MPAAAPWGMPSHYNRRLFTKDWDPMRTDTPVTVYRKDYQPYPTIFRKSRWASTWCPNRPKCVA